MINVWLFFYGVLIVICGVMFWLYKIKDNKDKKTKLKKMNGELKKRINGHDSHR